MLSVVRDVRPEMPHPGKLRRNLKITHLQRLNQTFIILFKMTPSLKPTIRPWKLVIGRLDPPMFRGVCCPKKPTPPAIIPVLPGSLTVKAPENKPGPKKQVHLPVLHTQSLRLCPWKIHGYHWQLSILRVFKKWKWRSELGKKQHHFQVPMLSFWVLL